VGSGFGWAADGLSRRREAEVAELQVIARHTIAAGNEDTVFPLLAELITAARTESGNLAFDAFRSIENPLTYVLLERYTSREAFAEHRETPHFKDIMLGQILPLLANREIEQYEVVGDTG
jgi:quinol monooxygenase YgiN